MFLYTSEYVNRRTKNIFMNYELVKEFAYCLTSKARPYGRTFFFSTIDNEIYWCIMKPIFVLKNRTD